MVLRIRGAWQVQGEAVHISSRQAMIGEAGCVQDTVSMEEQDGPNMPGYFFYKKYIPASVNRCYAALAHCPLLLADL